AATAPAPTSATWSWTASPPAPPRSWPGSTPTGATPPASAASPSTATPPSARSTVASPRAANPARSAKAPTGPTACTHPPTSPTANRSLRRAFPGTRRSDVSDNRRRRMRLLAIILLTLLLLPTTPAAAATNLAVAATPSASYTSPWENVNAINDGVDPPRSNDTANPRWGTWPETGTHWAELTWPTAQTLTSAKVYFFDDGGGVRLPASWKLQRWSGGTYIDIPGTYPTAADTYNRVTFPEISTVRLRVVLQSGAASVGLLEIKAHGESGTPAPWNPPAHLVTPLNEVWQHVEST